MKIKNISDSVVVVHDLLDNGVDLILRPGEEKPLYNEDTEKSAELRHFIETDILEILGDLEPEAGLGEHFDFTDGTKVIISNNVGDREVTLP